MPTKPAAKPAAKPAKERDEAQAPALHEGVADAYEPIDERAPRQGPLGEVERKTESDLIAEAAKSDDE